MAIKELYHAILRCVHPTQSVIRLLTVLVVTYAIG